MADILCPNCKQNNPDFLDLCQFCQTPLKPESMVHIGEKPTKKGTGELENALPEWLRICESSRASPLRKMLLKQRPSQRSRKNEAPDLLAGLASETKRADGTTSRLAVHINPIGKQSHSPPPLPNPKQISSHSSINCVRTACQACGKPSEKNVPSQPPAERDELSACVFTAAEQPAEPVSLEPDPIKMIWAG